MGQKSENIIMKFGKRSRNMSKQHKGERVKSSRRVKKEEKMF